MDQQEQHRARSVLILGATGSIGLQTIDVISELGQRFRIVGLSAGGNWHKLGELAQRVGAERVALFDEEAAQQLRQTAPGLRVFSGAAGIIELIEEAQADIVVVAIAGIAALEPMLAALRTGKRVAFASKEPLVAAGAIVMEYARRYAAELVPIDSEISAVFQCMQAVRPEYVEKIILTASGGPFARWPKEKLAEVTARQALEHPTWKMGKKVTIDSATLMNKGFEVFELHWLFGVPVEQIEVVVHHQSIIHSAIQLVDSSIIAQMSLPDMRAPIQYALTYPERMTNKLRRLDLAQTGELTFDRPDTERFPCLRLAYEAARAGGTYPAVLNAADEVAVDAFLAGRIRFTEIAEVVERTLERHQADSAEVLEKVMEATRWAQQAAEEEVTRLGAD